MPAVGRWDLTWFLKSQIERLCFKLQLLQFLNLALLRHSSLALKTADCPHYLLGLCGFH